MPWRIVDYTSSEESIEAQCILNPATNMTYRSLNMVIQLANELLQRYSGEFIVPDSFKFKKEEKGALLEYGHIKRSFVIPGTMNECSVYIIYVQPYKAPIPPVEERRRSARPREEVFYGDARSNEALDFAIRVSAAAAVDRKEEDCEEDDDIQFIQEVAPQLVQQLQNVHINPEVPRYLSGFHY